VGSQDHRDLNLGVLSRQGVRLVGRLAAINGSKGAFSGDLERTVTASHFRMVRTLDRIDASIDRLGIEEPMADPAVRAPIQAASDPVTLDLRREGIRSIIWATGYVRRYPWLKVPVLDHCGEIIHDGGLTPSPGLYVLGLTYLRRRRSSFINGCALDAEELAPLVKSHLDESAHQVA
jgi:putative flavoprotein involved in K+ transport